MHDIVCMSLRLLFIALLLTGLTGCITTVSRTRELRPGMTRAEVIKILGKPTSSNTSQDVEVDSINFTN